MTCAELGPDDRALFETAATALYEDIVASGGIDQRDPRIARGGPDRAAFDLLIEIGLLTQEPPDQAATSRSTPPRCSHASSRR